MRLTITTPTVAILSSYTPDELSAVRRILSYKDMSVLFEIKRLSKQQWFKKKNPEAYAAKLAELKRQITVCLVFCNEQGQYWIRPGSISYLTNVDIEVVNQIKYPTAHSYFWHKPLEITPYPYQIEAVKKLIEEKHGNIELATGTGKSNILLMITQQLGLRAAVVTPSEAIFREMYELFSYHLGEQRVGKFGSGIKNISKPITICIAKSLTTIKPGSREEAFFKDKQVLAFDESHSTPSSTFEAVCHGVLSDIPYRFLVSATQTRTSGEIELLQSIIGKTVIELPIEKAIAQGYLAKLKFKIIKTVTPLNLIKDDVMEVKRKCFLRNPNIAKIIAKIVNLSWEHKKQMSLILVEELVQIKMLADLLEAPFAYIHSSSQREAQEYGLNAVDLTEEIEKFNTGKVKVLIGTKGISCGVNLFPHHICCNWQGGSSEIVTKQGSIGRSTRLLHKSKYAHLHPPKDFVTIVDFDVENNPMLRNQLEKRLEIYQEITEDVEFIDIVI
jgi:superfamily II DNA or RNA helicase